MFDTYVEDELWSNTCFFKSAFLLLTRLSKLSGVDLFACDRKNRAKFIREAMFLELTDHWNSLGISAFTRSIHPIWESRSLKRDMIIKQVNSYYHRYAVNRGPSNELLFKWNQCDSPNCRNGCDLVETA